MIVVVMIVVVVRFIVVVPMFMFNWFMRMLVRLPFRMRMVVEMLMMFVRGVWMGVFFPIVVMPVNRLIKPH
jgi:hypothetical protein